MLSLMISTYFKKLISYYFMTSIHIIIFLKIQILVRQINVYSKQSAIYEF